MLCLMRSLFDSRSKHAGCDCDRPELQCHRGDGHRSHLLQVEGGRVTARAHGSRAQCTRLHLDLHQVAHTHKYISRLNVSDFFIKIHELISEKSIKLEICYVAFT